MGIEFEKSLKIENKSKEILDFVAIAAAYFYTVEYNNSFSITPNN